MAFISYRATRQIHLGQIRRALQVGDLIEFDGRTTRVLGAEHVIPTIGHLIGEGWLVPEAPSETALSVPIPMPLSVPAPAPIERGAPKRANHETPPRVDQEINVHGDKINYGSPEARAASGKRPKPNQEHVWDNGPTGWLNNLDGDRTCKVCGVTQKFQSLGIVDRIRGDGSPQYVYIDVHHKQVVSFTELSCPIYIGDPNSAAAIAKDQVRQVRGRVDDVEAVLETVDERLYRLEADNDFLRQRLVEMPVINAELIAEALLIVAAKTTPALAEGVRALLPSPTPELAVIEIVPILESIEEK